MPAKMTTTPGWVNIKLIRRKMMAAIEQPHKNCLTLIKVLPATEFFSKRRKNCAL